MLVVLCFAPVLGSTWVGIRRGQRVRKEHRPENNHLSTVQGAMLGLLGLLLGFAFSGAISRFVDRQDALAEEANAIETAHSRAALLSTKDRVRASLRAYADARVRLFRETSDGRRSELERLLQEHYDAAMAATIEGVRDEPRYATLCLTGVEDVGNQFSRRNALVRRNMPMEFVLVMLASTCACMWTVGYGAGLAERRSTGSVVILAGLTATALFVTFDFDRPRRGLIRLDPTPLIETATRIGVAAAI